MLLYLVRHAIAEELGAGKPDAERGLTDKGRARMIRAAQGLRKIDVKLELILTSPLKRARQTAEIIAQSLGGVELTELPELVPSGEPKALLEALKPYRRRESIALVGHQPLLGQFASLLLVGSHNLVELDFRKGAVACLEADLSHVGGAQHFTLRWHLSPRILRAI